MRIRLFWMSCGRWKNMHAQNYSLWKYDEICGNQSYYCWQVCLNGRKCLDMFSLASVSLAIQFNTILVTPCCTDNMSKAFYCVKFSDFSNTWTRLDQMQPRPEEFVFILVWQPSCKQRRLDLTLLKAMHSHEHFRLWFWWFISLNVPGFMQISRKIYFLPLSLSFIMRVMLVSWRSQALWPSAFKFQPHST